MPITEIPSHHLVSFWLPAKRRVINTTLLEGEQEVLQQE